MFLLSPKTDAQEYELVSTVAVSINGGPEQTYGNETAPGTVKAGDVLTWTEDGGSLAGFFYYDGEGEKLANPQSKSPYTIEAVPGAVSIEASLIVL